MQTLGKNLLAVVLRENRLSDFYLLKRDYFAQDECQIYDWILEHVQKYGVLPSLDMTTRRIDLEGPDSEDPYGVWYDQYTDRALYNQLESLLPRIQQELGKRKPSAALDHIIQFVEGAHAIRADQQRDVATMVQTMREVMTEYERVKRLGGMSGIPSGWNYLDAMTLGWQRGDLSIIAARPGIGKSQIMAYLATAAHTAGFIPMLVTMEMKRVQMGRRILSLTSKIHNGYLKAGLLSGFAERKLQEELVRFEQSSPYYVVEGNFRKNFNELASLIHSLRPHILIVDGAYLLKVPHANPKMARWEQVTLIAEALKDIAYHHNIPVVASFQITREGGKKINSGGKLGVEYLQLSDAIGQLASVALAVIEDDEDENPEAMLQRRIEIIKGREGEQGRFYINWDFDQSNFDEIPGEGAQVTMESTMHDTPEEDLD